MTKDKGGYRMTIDDFKQDFTVIEEIVQNTGTPCETFYFGDMFPSIMTNLHNVFYADLVTKDDVDTTSVLSWKDGFHTILFLILQLCIISHSSHVVDDLNTFWKAFDEFVLKERHLPDHLHHYGNLFHCLNCVSVGFQNVQVSHISRSINMKIPNHTDLMRFNHRCNRYFPSGKI